MNDNEIIALLVCLNVLTLCLWYLDRRTLSLRVKALAKRIYYT